MFNRNYYIYKHHFSSYNLQLDKEFNKSYCGVILSSVLVVHYSFEVAETVGTPAADKEACHISVVHNEIPVDADILEYDDSYMDLATMADYAEVHLAVVDCNLAVGYALHPVETAVMVVDYRTKRHANVVRRPEIS